MHGVIQQEFQETRPSEHTWTAAATKWLEETSHKKDHKHDQEKLCWIAKYWHSKALHEVNRESIQHLTKIKASEAKPSTVNRYLALIRSILRRAENEWEWIDKAPHIRLLPEPSRRVRYLSPEQARALLEQLPEHLRHAAIFALSTGLRAGNVLRLTWDQVDLDRRICLFDADQMKNGEDFRISLNDDALHILHVRRHKHPEYCFTYHGKPFKCFSTKAWHNALERAGIENFRWHDLRHTWASWLVQKGVPLYALQEMGGWKNANMVRRYAHLSPDTNLQYLRKLDGNLPLE
jgi:integrase